MHLGTAEEFKKGKKGKNNDRKIEGLQSLLFIQTLQYAKHLEVKKLQNSCRLRLSPQFH